MESNGIDENEEIISRQSQGENGFTNMKTEGNYSLDVSLLISKTYVKPDTNNENNNSTNIANGIGSSSLISSSSVTRRQTSSKGVTSLGADVPVARDQPVPTVSVTTEVGCNYPSYSPTNISDNIGLLQATVFIEDAVKYRDISHKVDKTSLQIYRLYYSSVIEIFRYSVIFVLHILAFFEYPSSLTWTSDIRFREARVEVPCGVTQGIELLCLVILFLDMLLQLWLCGKSFFTKKWLMTGLFVLAFSLVDWSVTIGMQCKETNRVRRILRPFFIIIYSSLMKKTIKCLKRTLPQVISVLMLLALHLYIFTLIGMLLFPKPLNKTAVNNSTGATVYLDLGNTTNHTTPSPNNSSTSDIVEEGDRYFRSISQAFMSLLVLLTTANNPDVMMPVYQNNRLYSLYFIVFLIIGNYCFMNMFLAVIYNQFRGYFQTSMQSSLLRRRVGVRAAYEVLRDNYTDITTCQTGSAVSVSSVRIILEHAVLPPYVKKAIKSNLDQRPSFQDNLSLSEFQQCFEIMDRESFHREKPDIKWCANVHLRRFQKFVAHRFYNYFGNLVAFANVVVISVELTTEYDETLSDSRSDLNIVNFVFILYYLLEQITKVVALGPKRYMYDRWNIFDGIITVALVVAEIVSFSKYGTPLSKRIAGHKTITMWNIVRIINILIMFRLLRIIPHIKAMAIVANTLADLIKNLKSFAGVLVVIYYSFAILGIEIFHDKIKYEKVNKTGAMTSLVYPCGTYQQLEYWANNFDDFAAAIVVLWDVMVVNNWSIFLQAYAKAMSSWTYIYFIAWWLLSVVIVLQLFTALIIENFIMKWDRLYQLNADGRVRTDSEFEESQQFMSVHDMFRGNLQEPSEEEIMMQITSHKYLSLGSSFSS